MKLKKLVFGAVLAVTMCGTAFSQPTFAGGLPDGVKPETISNISRLSAQGMSVSAPKFTDTYYVVGVKTDDCYSEVPTNCKTLWEKTIKPHGKAIRIKFPTAIKSMLKKKARHYNEATAVDITLDKYRVIDGSVVHMNSMGILWHKQAVKYTNTTDESVEDDE